METLRFDHDVAVPLESVLCTEELKRRPSRPPDYSAENKALLALAQELTNAPESVLQKLVDIALVLCRGHSSGISLLEADAPGDLDPAGDHFRWHAVAGMWAPLAWNTTTRRDNGPCGTVLDRDTTLLFSNAHRYYTQFAAVRPLLIEGLLVPFHVQGEAVGTVWVVAHDESRKFDAEDQRVLESLATFAAAAYQVRLSIAAQAEANEDLQSEIHERERVEEALREIDRHKSEFLAILAHELRNPLAPIVNALQILRMRPRDEEVGQSALAMMERQVGQVVRLVDDLLDVSRISQGKIELRKESTDLAPIIDRAVETIRPLSEVMGHELTVTLPSDPIRLTADPIRLAQVIGNLLQNACKFTERGGRIRLIVERKDRRAVVRVQDNGMGMSADQLPRIFELFAQLQPSRDEKRDGLGIGLTLVKKLAEMHEGKVEARSGGIGKGSEFILYLPINS